MSIVEEASSDLEPLEQILASAGHIEQSDLIPILHRIQAVYGYLPPDVLTKLSSDTGIPPSRVYGVVSFYEQFHLEPHGRHTIRCCRGTACHVRGGRGVIRCVSRTLGIEQGQTTEDMEFTFDGVYYGKMTLQKTKMLLHHLMTAGMYADESRNWFPHPSFISGTRSLSPKSIQRHR